MKPLGRLLASAALLFPVAAAAQTPDATPSPSPIHVEAGQAGEWFFLRSSDDSFVLMPAGRFEYDFYAFEGGQKAPPDAFLPKRVRIEAFGTILKRYDFQLGSEFTAAAPALTDAYVSAAVIAGRPELNLQIGQFDAPFTMENRTSDKWPDLQERSVVVRAFGYPENKMNGAMLWGQPRGKWAFWSGGIGNGEGFGQPLAHRSKNFVGMGRAWIAPFALAGAGGDTLKNVWIGGSAFTGDPTPSVANQNDLYAMKTQGGFTFFNPVTTGVVDHLGLYGAENRWAMELNAPLGPVVFKSEVVGVNERTRETGTAIRERFRGSGFYARLSWFPFGDPLINGLGGMQIPPHLFGDLKPSKTASALQLVAEADHLHFRITSDDPLFDPFAAGGGGYDVDVYSLGANWWQTKHVRWTGDFLYYLYGGASARPLASSSRAYEATFRVQLVL